MSFGHVMQATSAMQAGQQSMSVEQAVGVRLFMLVAQIGFVCVLDI